MSSIEVVGSSGIDPGFLRQLQADPNQALRRAPVGMGTQGAGPSAGAMTQRLESVAEEAGLDPETIGALREDLKAAISGAMDNASADAADADPREAFRKAIDDTLTKYGIKPESLRPDGAVAEKQGAFGGRAMPGESRGSNPKDLLGSQNQPANDSLLNSLLELLGLVDEKA
jgi:hypothetical protein